MPISFVGTTVIAPSRPTMSANLHELFEGADAVIHLAGQPGVRLSWSDYFHPRGTQRHCVAESVGRGTRLASSPELHEVATSSNRSGVSARRRVTSPLRGVGIRSRRRSDPSLRYPARSQRRGALPTTAVAMRYHRRGSPGDRRTAAAACLRACVGYPNFKASSAIFPCHVVCRRRSREISGRYFS